MTKISNVIPGELHFADGKVVINPNSKSYTITMENKGDRPIQIGSHFHLYEVNSSIVFYNENGTEDKDRKCAWGRRFDIASGTSIRFEPAEKKQVQIIDMAGERKVYGLNNLCDGDLTKGPKTPYSELDIKKCWK